VDCSGQQYPAELWGRNLLRNLHFANLASFTIRIVVVCQHQWIEFLKSFPKLPSELKTMEWSDRVRVFKPFSEKRNYHLTNKQATTVSRAFLPFCIKQVKETNSRPVLCKEVA